MEETKIVESGGENTEGIDSSKYLETIKKLKEETVSRDSYLKLKEENRQLLDAYASGSGNATAEPQKEVVPLADLKSHLMKDGISNLDYITTALEIRNRVLKEEGKDLFVANGAQYAATAEDIASAERVATALQEMVDVAEGNPDIFNNEFQRRVKDIPLPKRNAR